MRMYVDHTHGFLMNAENNVNLCYLMGKSYFLLMFCITVYLYFYY